MASTSTRLRRSLISVLATSLAGVGLGVMGPLAADAATAGVPYNVVDRPASAVTADALPTVQIDGVVWDQAVNGDTVYAGGQFANARPAGAAAGTSQTPRYNLLSYNIRTGVMNGSFAPNVNGRIRAMTLSPDKSRLYIAGSFTTVNGATRNRIAAFNTADGSLSSWAPTVSSDVWALVATANTVYIGGGFGSVNGVGRTKLAAINASTGATTGWAPTADGTINSMTKTPDSSRIIIGGMFANLNGDIANGLGSVDASTAALYPFAANQIIKDYGTQAGIYSLKSDATNIYGTGYWFGGTAGNFEGPFVLDPYTGAIKWLADCHGDTYDTSVIGGTVYSVSHHHDCSNISAFPEVNPRVHHRANAFTLAATTTVGPNTVGGYGNFDGQPAPSLVNWFPDVSAGTYTGQSQGGWTSEASSEYLVQGGEFKTVNGTGQQGLVRFAVSSLATNKQGPRVAAVDSAPALRSISGTSVRASWPANWDRDNIGLTYKLYRSDKPSTPLVTLTAESTFWNRPTQIFTDTGLTPSTSYGYWVTASDASGNSLRSTTTTVTTGTKVIDNSAYSQAVLNDGASHYWRLDDDPGQSPAIDWASGNDLVLGNGVTNGAAGAINNSPDTAASFDGTGNGTGGQSTIEPGTNTFSTEAWFKTTSTSGGKIVGFGDSQLGTSNSYDRHIYMDNTGHLVFGVCCPGGVQTIITPGTYNDGAYHQVVTTMSASGGIQLYVDGLLEASNIGVSTAQPFNGYWRVGGDNLGGWPYEKTSQFFNGTIDDVSVYPSALSVAQVRDHYTKSGRTVNIPPEPTDTYGKRVYNDAPSLFWRLNETAGTTVADSSQGRTSGDAFNGVSFGSSSPVAPGTAATFDGSQGTISSAKVFSNPRTYSEEVWFNTTTTNGGKLIGFANARSGGSSGYDRHVYMESGGQLTFGVYTGELNTTTSPKGYNDGAWHHVVATQDIVSGMKLYVDGVVVGTNPQTSAQPYDGYWRIGADTAWNGSFGFAGTLDEAAVYPVALTAAQVAAHYQASAAATNAAPVADFTSSCTDAACFFDGSASSDPDGSIASHAWDFGDGGTATTATASHTYAASGTYVATLTVTDNKGKTTSVTRDVTVTVPVPNQAPIASFTSSCDQLACAFSSAGSSDPDGTISSYAWNFGDTGTSVTANPQHSYTADGTYNVTLTVTDNKGTSTTVTEVVRVKANVKPVASFTSDCTNLVCSFDAGSSVDPDGSIASYSWNFGDGTTATGATTSHTFTAGSHDVTLTVTDNQGATDPVTRSVNVSAANQSPSAAFTSTAANLTASFNGSGSTDADGTIAGYAWDFGDSKTGTGQSPSHSYTSAGSYDVTLTVTDNRGGTDQVTRSITVTAPANVAPTAAFGATVAGLKVTLDAADSTDSDGTLAGYAWTYGDGESGTGVTSSHTYAAAGTYAVKLVVTDDDGATGSVTKSVTVAAAPVDNTLAKDGFARTAAGWGSADTGGAWTSSGGTYFSTAGGKGLITMNKAGAGPSESLGVSALNSSTTLDFSVNKLATGSGTYVTLTSRRSGTSEVRLKGRLMADNTVRLLTTTVVGGTETTLREITVSGLTYQANEALRIRFDVSSTGGTTTLAGKIWKSSATEPAQAQVTSTTTAAAVQSAGTVSVQAYLSGSSTNAPVVMSIDDYLVTRTN